MIKAIKANYSAGCHGIFISILWNGKFIWRTGNGESFAFCRSVRVAKAKDLGLAIPLELA